MSTIGGTTENISSSTSVLANSYSKDRTLFQTTSGTLFKIYSDGSNLVYETSSDVGNNWSGATTIQASATTDDTGFSGWIDHENNIHLVYSNNDTNDYIFYRLLTYDRDTDTWSIGAEQTVENTGTSQDYPSATFDSFGKIHVFYRFYDGTNYTIATKTSTDDGATWSAATTLTDSSNTDANIYPLGLIWNSNPTLIYNYQNASIKYNYYDGTSWQSAGWANETITSEVDADTGLEFSADGTMENGHLHLAWRGSGTNGILYRENSNDPAGWDATSTAITTDHNDRNPSLAASLDNSVYVYYSDYIAANSYDIKYRVKRGGASFSDSVAVTSDGLNNLHPSATYKYITAHNYAVDFPGVVGNHVDGTTSPSISGNFTLAVWLNKTANTGPNSTVYDLGDFSTGFGMWINSSGYIGWRINGSYNHYKSAASTTVGEWQHFAIAYNGSTVKIYKNGLEVSSEAYSTNPLPVTDYTRIGCREGSYECFKGKVDDARVYSRALDPSEIEDSYQGYPPVSGLEQAYDLNEGSGTVVNDITGSGHNLSFTGSPLWTDGRFDNYRDNIGVSQVSYVTGTSSPYDINFGPTFKIWDNDSGDGQWDTPSNWSDDTLPQAGDDVLFSSTSSTDCLLNPNSDLSGITLSSINLSTGYTSTLTLEQTLDDVVDTLTVSGDITIDGGTILAQSERDGTPVNGVGFEINASNVAVGSGGHLSADETGFTDMQGPGAGHQGGGTNSSGGAHGGEGGYNYVNGVYGSITDPTSLGSGGAHYVFGSERADPGGGAITINTTIISNYGTISANGGAGERDAAGSAGGSVNITADSVIGSGLISADGGNGFYIGGGGGGRVAISYASIFENTLDSSAVGGTGQTYMGAAGTIYLNNTTTSEDELIINNNIENSKTFTKLRSATTPTTADLAVDTLTLEDKGLFQVASGHTFNYTTLNWEGGGLVHAGSIPSLPSDFTVGSGKYITKGVTPTFNSLTIQSGGVVSHWGNTDAHTYDLQLTITTDLEIQAGGRIDAESLGYTNKQGPGKGTDLADGASYGGWGGNNTAAGPYGSIENPVDIGSGGAPYQAFGTHISGSGGGRIHLDVGGTLDVEGVIMADGGDYDPGSYASGGSGGTINIQTDTLSGSGLFSANGGEGRDGGGGSGGRVAIRYANNLSSSIVFQAHGGSGGGSVPSAGTTYLNNTATGVDELIIDNNNFEDTATNKKLRGATTPTMGDLTVDTLTLKNKALFEVASGHTFNYTTLNWEGGGLVHAGSIPSLPSDFTVGSGKYITKGVTPTFNSLTIQDGGVVSHWGNTTDHTYDLQLTITTDLEIQTGGKIDVDSLGYMPDSGPGGITSEYLSGGSYGGWGGRGTLNGPYGSVKNPADIGSGGWSYRPGFYNDYGGSGGGRVNIISGSVQTNGSISANGGNQISTSAGGSGGTINILTSAISGSGIMSAEGGDGEGSAGGGSGGRVAIEYSDDSFSAVIYEAHGGVGARIGATGTVYLNNTTTGTEELIIDNNNSEDTSTYGKLRGATTPTTSDLTVDTLTLKNKALFEVASGHTFTYTTLNWEGGGLVHAGSIPSLPSDFTVGSGKYITKGVTPTFNSLTIQDGGVVSHWGNTDAHTYDLQLTITTDLDIQAGGKIDVESLGFRGQQGPGAGNANYIGASHGGWGGRNITNGPYGSINNPITLGSGGGNDIYGGSGGGAVIINISGELILAGDIIADGGNGENNTSGGGSGGSININTNTISGTGSVGANGGLGDSDSTTYGSGGGGRIAIQYSDDSGSSVNYNAFGGHYGSFGAAGTIYLNDAIASEDTLIIDNNNSEDTSTYRKLRGVATPTTSDLTVDTLTLKNKALFEVASGHTFNYTTLNWEGGGLVHAGSIPSLPSDFTVGSGKYITKGVTPTFNSLTIQSGGVVSHWGNTDAHTYDLQLTITTDLDIQAGGKIDVESLGFRGQQGPGAGNANYIGASHGGWGGKNITNGPYDTVDNPTGLGSGGGHVDRGGSGGGAVLLDISGELTLAGDIIADGGNGTNTYGAGGSGGSVKVNVGSVLGSGSISANGGLAYSNSTTYGSGAGGRIALIVNESFALDVSNITVTGGARATPGEDGTLYIPPTTPTFNYSASTTSITWQITDTSISESEFRIYDSGDILVHTIASTTEGTTGTLYEWEESSLTPSTQYSRYVKAYSSSYEAESAASATLSPYTLANVPGEPTVDTPGTTSLKITFTTNSNGELAEYAIYDEITGNYIQADGSQGATEAWQTYDAWGGASGVTDLSLSPNVEHTYKVKAKNPDDVETALSAGSSLYTLANPPTALTVNTKSSSSITWQWSNNSNPAGTEYYILDESGNSGWITDQSWATTASANTNYSAEVKARNGDGVETASDTESTSTHIEQASSISSSAKPDEITLTTTAIYSNLSTGSSGIQYCNTTTSSCSDWLQNTTPYSFTGLDPETSYDLTIQTRNQDSETSTLYELSHSTSSGTTLILSLPGQTFTNGLGLSGSIVGQNIGVPFNIGIYSVDSNNWLDEDKTDQITFASSDGFAILPGPTNLSAGSLTQSITLNTAGTVTIGITATGYDQVFSSVEVIGDPDDEDEGSGDEGDGENAEDDSGDVPLVNNDPRPIVGPGGEKPADPIAKIFVSEKTIVGLSTEISAFGSLANNNGEIVKYVWKFEDGTEATGYSINKVFDQVGYQTISLAVTNDGGCHGYAEKEIAVIPYAPVISDIYEKDDQVIFEGSSYPLTKIDLFINQENEKTTESTADENGKWQISMARSSSIINSGKNYVWAYAIEESTDLKSDISEKAVFNIFINEKEDSLLDSIDQLPTVTKVSAVAIVTAVSVGTVFVLPTLTVASIAVLGIVAILLLFMIITEFSLIYLILLIIVLVVLAALIFYQWKKGRRKTRI